MKNFLAAVSAIGLSAFPANADITGSWKSEANENGEYIIVKIEPCGPSFCGDMVDTNAPRREVIGTQIVQNMTPEGNNKYAGGRIYAPDTEKWYNGKLELLSNSQLKVAGCVLGGLVCRSQTWTRQ